MIEKNEVTLNKKQVKLLEEVVRRGKRTPQKRKRALALLRSFNGWTDKDISEKTDLTINAIVKIRKRFVESGFELTLNGFPKCGRTPIMTARDETRLCALARKKRPDGAAHKSMRTLAVEFVTLEGKRVSAETIRRTLNKNGNQTRASR
jgi:hypothetical protein